MTYTDEDPEISFVLRGSGWSASVGGEVIPLVAWVVLDNAKMHGVVVGEDGRVDLSESVEERDDFVGYRQQERGVGS